MRRILPNGYSRAVLIGKGSFGTVFRAREDELGRWVALKEVPHGDAAARDEAQALAAAPLPCLPAVYGIESGRRSDWIAMEYVHGVSIREAISQGLDPIEAAALSAETVRSLAVLHRSGRSHGDLKPENLIVEPDGHVRLVDLGMAAKTESVQGGTAGYLAPERGSVRCDPRRADLWSLGVVVHEILVGARPAAQEGPNGWKRLRKEWGDWVPLVDLLLREDASRRPASAEIALSDLPSAEPLPPSVLERIQEQADRALARRMVDEADYRLRHDEPSEALGYLQQALELDPDQSQALAMLPLIKLDKNRPRRTRRIALAAAAAVLVVALFVAFGPRRTRSEGATVKATTADGMVVNERLRIDRGVPNEKSLPLREGTGSGR
jgi:serine/threonine protein kinase